MTRTAPTGSELGPLAASGLEDLVAIAAVIGAGCERCAGRSVRWALQRGCAGSSIERTLEVVERLRAHPCLVQAIGPQVIAAMERPLRAARQALGEADHTAQVLDGRPTTTPGRYND